MRSSRNPQQEVNPMSNTREVRTAKQAEEEDVFFGQTVIMWARWSVIVSGIARGLWTSTNVARLPPTRPFFLALLALHVFPPSPLLPGPPLHPTPAPVARVSDLV